MAHRRIPLVRDSSATRRGPAVALLAIGLVAVVFESLSFVFQSAPRSRLAGAATARSSPTQSLVQRLAEEEGFDDAGAWEGEEGGERFPITDLKVGQELQGVVISVAPFGAFCDVGADRDGLVHISRISEGFVDNIDDYVQPGNEVKVWVTEVSEDGRLGLSMVEGKAAGGGGGQRAPQGDIGAFQDVPPSEWLPAVVRSTTGFGVFVAVSPPGGGDEVQGLVHVSQIRDGFVESPHDEVSIGQEVQVRVLNCDVVGQRLSLSMREEGSGPPARDNSPPVDLTPFESVGVNEWLKGTVASTTGFGIFVKVPVPDSDEEAQGLVHVTQIRDGFVEDPGQEVEIGQEVQIRIVQVDVDGNRLSLSMKDEAADEGGYDDDGGY